MDLVIDANIVFSALIKQGLTQTLLLDGRLHGYAPYYLLEEVLKHKEFLLAKTKLTDMEFESILTILKRKIWFYSSEMYGALLQDAELVCPDPDDIPYFALALKLDIPLWSNDKRLKEQLVVRIVSTRELLDAFQRPLY